MSNKNRINYKESVKAILFFIFLSFSLFLITEKIRAAECTSLSSWGSDCEVNGNSGHCYFMSGKPTCLTEEGEEGEPCGDSGGVCTKGTIYCPVGFDHDKGGRDCDGIGLLCCAESQGCNNKNWGDSCQDENDKVGNCYNDKCEIGDGSLDDPCGNEEGSRCLASCPESAHDYGGRDCSDAGMCCKKSYSPTTECETKIGGTCEIYDQLAPTDCSAGRTGVGEYGCKESEICCARTCEQAYDGVCKATSECSENKTAAYTQECITQGKVCCAEEEIPPGGNPCGLLEGTCKDSCGGNYTISNSDEADDYCDGKREGDMCCVLSECAERGGKCVKKDATCEDNELSSFSDSCWGDTICCGKKGSGGATTKTDFNYDNPLKVSSLTEWIYNLLGSVQGIVGWLAVIMIVLGGVIYILSGGSEKQTSLAKSIILWALVGFAIAVAAPALMKGIKDLIAGDGGGGATDIIDNANSVKQIIVNILAFLLSAVGVLALISFAIGGFMYLFSGGDSSRTDTAKKIILYSIIAVAVSGAGVILLRQVMGILEATV